MQHVTIDAETEQRWGPLRQRATRCASSGQSVEAGHVELPTNS